MRCHVHDVIYPDREHRVTFGGTVPFRNLLAMIPTTLPLVWELVPNKSAEAIRAALDQGSDFISA
ncbi:MAG: hypothetical protein JO271_02665 [Verrucomicrobia bacterium]|nr:hypothetical protein [Verrucomicrobiota bacterium]MBV9272719.1 hypothetical protein [Verrucomicrobiota bacterium]